MRDELRQEEADRRRRSNRYSTTNKGITGNAELYGVAGEDAWIAWCQSKGLVAGPRPEKRHRGVQFRSAGIGVKILCSPTPGHLLVKADTKEWADIYVLASYDAHRTLATLIGWLPGSCVRAAPVRDMAKAGADYRLVSHAVKSRDLASMSMLEEVMKGALDMEAVEAWFESDGTTTLAKPAAPPAPQLTQAGFDFGMNLVDRTR